MTNSPIATAIAPLRDAAIADANAQYDLMVAKAVAKLEAAGWDLDVAAPRPNGNMDRGDYMRMRAVCGFFSSITRPLTCGRRIDEPDMVAAPAQPCVYCPEAPQQPTRRMTAEQQLAEEYARAPSAARRQYTQPSADPNRTRPWKIVGGESIRPPAVKRQRSVPSARR